MRLVATSPSSQGDFRALLAISPLPSLVPIETQVGVVKLWAFNSSFQMSSIWSSWVYLAAIFDSGSGGLTWNHMSWVFFPPVAEKGLLVVKVMQQKYSSWRETFLCSMVPGAWQPGEDNRTVLSGKGARFCASRSTKWIWRLSQLAVPTPSAPILPSVHLG